MKNERTHEETDHPVQYYIRQRGRHKTLSPIIASSLLAMNALVCDSRDLDILLEEQSERIKDRENVEKRGDGNFTGERLLLQRILTEAISGFSKLVAASYAMRQ